LVAHALRVVIFHLSIVTFHLGIAIVAIVAIRSPLPLFLVALLSIVVVLF
jgi:hypothetical protein